MPRLLTLTRPTPATISARIAVDGVTVRETTFRSTTPSRRAELAKITALSADDLARLIEAVPVGGTTETPLPEPPGAAPATIGISLRGLAQPAETAIRDRGPARDIFIRFLQVDSVQSTEPILRWDSVDAVAALDVDYRSRPLDDAAARLRVMSLSPRPEIAWRTHGGGLRGIYFATREYTAAELAAVAAISIRVRDPYCSVEVKADTRHPLYRRGSSSCGPLICSTPTDHVDAVRFWLSDGEVDDTAVAEWLEDHGIEKGRRYPHDRCPIEPNVGAHGEPVFVGDYGIHCDSCSALGRGIGRRPGFVGWGTIVGRAPSVLGRLVRGLCHWTHARHVLTSVVGGNADVLRRAYAAALKLYHGHDDPRVGAAMRVGGNLIRCASRWVNPVDGVSYGKDIPHMLAALPACQAVADGEVRVRRDVVNLFQQPVSLLDHGYPALTPIRGLPIYSQYLTYGEPDRVDYVVFPPELQPDAAAAARPKYVSADRRDLDAAWATIEEVFPGVVRPYLRLLIAAKGVSEGRVGITPAILVNGPSGAAKSATVLLAAAISGDHNTEIQYQSDNQRFRQAVMEGAERGTYVTLNEAVKEGRKSRRNPKAALEELLNLTSDSVSHKLYHGPTPLGPLPVLIFTDVTIPQSVRDDVQLSRRIVFVRLPSRVNWETPLRDYGVYQIQRFRVSSPRYAHAADVILSDVIDEFFRESPRDLKEIATALGYGSLESSKDFDDPTDALLEFFALYCDAPPDRSGTWRGDGWVAIDRSYQTPLVRLWERLAPGEDWTESQSVSGADWTSILRSRSVVRVDVRAGPAGVVGVRFYTGDPSDPKPVVRG